MRCKKHPIDTSSRVGVCASCLRERLSAIMAAQALKEAQQDCRKSDTQPPPPPISFPRSVSPYISRRKSDTTAAAWRHPHDHRRFYSTPQVGPTGSITIEINNKSSKGRGISSLFSGFFRSKSENKPDSGPGPVSDPRVLIDSCTATPSWFSNLIPGGRKKKIQRILIDERNRGRGMSPSGNPDYEDEHCQSSGYSSDSQGWKQTPRRTPASRRRGGGNSKSVSGLAFCLSPLVRPSPNPHSNQKGIPPEMIVSGESRVTPKSHLPIMASLCKNRSRKLAGFGRYTYDPTH